MMRPMFGIVVVGSAAAFPVAAACGLVDPGLIVSGASASRLIDHIGREIVAHQIGCPTFRSLRRRLDTGSRMGGAVPNDDGPLLRSHGHLELHVHLADSDLRVVRRRGRPKWQIL